MNYIFKSYSQQPGRPVSEEIGFLHVRETQDGNYFVCEREDPESAYMRRSDDVYSKEEALIEMARILNVRRSTALCDLGNVRRKIRDFMQEAAP